MINDCVKKTLKNSLLVFTFLNITFGCNIVFSNDKSVISNNYSKASINLTNKFKNLKNLTADFTQNVVTKNSREVSSVTSTGKLWLSKPSYFKWDIVEPSPQILVSNGKTLWNYDELLEQVTIQKIQTDLTQAPFLILLTGNPATLNKTFIVSQKDKNTFELKPKNIDQSILSSVDVVFNGDKLSKLNIKSDLGADNIIYFYNQSDKIIAKSAYKFIIPEDVDVFGEENV